MKNFKRFSIIASLILIILFCNTLSLAKEQITLSTPISCNNYQMQKIVLDWPNLIIHIWLVCMTDGSEITFTYSGAQADSLLKKLNKAGSKSLHKYVFEQLVTDKKLTGTISGTPD